MCQHGTGRRKKGFNLTYDRIETIIKIAIHENQGVDPFLSNLPLQNLAF